MSASLGSILLALVTLFARFARFADFAKALNTKKQTDTNYTLRKSKSDLDKLLLALKTRRKIRNENSKLKNTNSDAIGNAADKLRKPKDKYQR